MKIKATCYFCRMEAETDWIATIELDKWPYIEMKCDKGHRQRYMMSTELYELLFEQATRCLLDRYYREAIGTYNAALERFFEYAIEMMLTSKGDIDFTQFWKSIDRQSERQLGAYYGLWASTFNELPVTLDEKKVKLRNEIVHKGKLASRKEAEEFGQYVFNYITPNAAKINSLYPGMPLTKVARTIRKSQKDIENEQKDPIFVDYCGEKSILATSILRVSCLLNNPSITSFEDCIKTENVSEYLRIV